MAGGWRYMISLARLIDVSVVLVMPYIYPLNSRSLFLSLALDFNQGPEASLYPRGQSVALYPNTFNILFYFILFYIFLYIFFIIIKIIRK
jgi:hypothetical protein